MVIRVHARDGRTQTRPRNTRVPLSADAYNKNSLPLSDVDHLGVTFDDDPHLLSLQLKA